MSVFKSISATFLFFVCLFSAQSAQAKNLHLIDANPASGFAIYRTGQPGIEDMKELCRLGVTEIAVMSGDATEVEERLQHYCPTLKVVYNVAQNARVSLSAKFLADFDSWVENSMRQGKKITFRCSCGCHRTGRLAAYYQMKYQGLTSDAAIDVMYNLGHYMWWFPELKSQVRALEDFIKGRPCSSIPYYCVR